MYLDPRKASYHVECLKCDKMHLVTDIKRPKHCPVCYSPDVVVREERNYDENDDTQSEK